jgi:hypothetical protein
MRSTELRAFQESDYLDEIGDVRVIRIVQPALQRLIDALVALPEDASSTSKLQCFETCINELNEVQHDIDTITREALCDRLYELGELVGLDASAGFLDRWRDF